MSNCGSRKMRDGGPAAPIMPEEVKKRRKKRSMAQDTTKKPPRSAYKEMGYTDAELKKMGFKYGGAVKKMAGGGEAFPDLTGDGKVTKKDILKGRGVKGFEAGGEVCRGMGAAIAGGKYTGCK